MLCPLQEVEENIGIKIYLRAILNRGNGGFLIPEPVFLRRGCCRELEISSKVLGNFDGGGIKKLLF